MAFSVRFEYLTGPPASFQQASPVASTGTTITRPLSKHKGKTVYNPPTLFARKKYDHFALRAHPKSLGHSALTGQDGSADLWRLLKRLIPYRGARRRTERRRLNQ